MSKPSTDPVWQARTGTAPAPSLVTFGDSTAEDEALVAVDLAGSVAHAAGLAGTLHTARSRNDQVALDTVLHTRLALVHLADGCHSVAKELAGLATTHASTPWAAKTHGQPAQPATLGFLFHAHALRFSQLADQALGLFDQMDESPLGSGAVAGTTLPIQPAYTAQLLGLQRPKNGLLATATRDHGLAAAQLVARIGVVASSLAQDLFELHNQGLVSLPSDHTTGSSMMPQKRNPDAAELVRAKATALAGPSTQIQGLLSGMGLSLGYQRDLQIVKAQLIEALAQAQPVLDLLAELLPGLEANQSALAAGLEDQGLVATDLAEALVYEGMAFRQAYRLVAEAQAAVEDGAELQEALIEQGLDPALVDQVLAASTQGAAARGTCAGPAPVNVTQAASALEETLGQLAARIVAAEEQANVPLELLTTDPAQLVTGTEEVA